MVRTELDIEGGRITLQMDFEAVCEIEDRLGMGIIAISTQLADGMLRLRDMLEIVRVCAAPPMAKEDMSGILLGKGVFNLAECLAELLCMLLEGRAGSIAGAPRRAELEELMTRFPDPVIGEGNFPSVR